MDTDQHQVLKKRPQACSINQLKNMNFCIYPQGEYFYNDANKDYPFISSWNAFPNIKPNKEFCSLDAVIYPKYLIVKI